MNKGRITLVSMRQVMGKKNKPTTFRKSWLGLNISSRPLFMRSAPHVNCSDGKGRDKNLNVQGICEEFLRNCEELREKLSNLARIGENWK